MKNKKQNKISSNLVRNRYRDVPEDHHDRIRLEGFGNSLDWLQRVDFLYFVDGASCYVSW